MMRNIIAAAVLAAAILPSPTAASAQAPPPFKPTRAAKLTGDLFYAISDGSIDRVRAALAKGADPNGRNWLSFTPLQFASFVGKLDVMQELLSHHAVINDDSMFGSAVTNALLTRHDAAAVYLLNRGAKPNPPRFDKSSPLMVAAETGCTASMRKLISRKANVNQRNDDGASALTFAARANQREAVRVLLAAGASVNSADNLKRTPLHYAALAGSRDITAMLAKHGAAVNAVDGGGATPLCLAAHYSGSADTVKALLAAGADTSRADSQGRTPVQLATRRGYGAVAEALMAPGHAGRAEASNSGLRQASIQVDTDTLAGAQQRALGAIQTCMSSFHQKSACLSCHHQGLGLAVVGAAAHRGLPADAKLIGEYVGQFVADAKSSGAVMHAAAANPALSPLVPAVDIGDFVSGSSYFMAAAHANGVPANPGLADVALVTGGLQFPDGSWRYTTPRGAMEQSYFTMTAMTLEGLQSYWPADRKAELQKRMERAQAWLRTTPTRTAEDRIGRLWGLKVTGADEPAVAGAAAELMTAQRSDGGWGFPGTEMSNAHTTGMALYVLLKSGASDRDSENVKRAIAFLVRTQDEDGTWYVPKLTAAYNNHFDASFPHGYEQYASFVGTCWAELALMEAAAPARN